MTAMLRPAALLACLAVLLSACGGARSRAPRPSPLALGEAPPPPLQQRLRVVALADERFRRVPEHRARIGQRIDELSDQLAARVGLRLDLLAVEAWESRGVDHLEHLLVALEEAKPAIEADLVIAFTAAPPPRRTRMDDLVRSRYAGRYVVVRSLTPYFAAGDLERLHEAEVLALMHGVGHVFGALPVCGPAVMSTRADFRTGDRRAWRWSGFNLELMRIHATLDLRRGGGERIPADIARRALGVLANPPRETACAAEALAQRRELLSAVVQAPPPQAPAPPAEDGAIAAGLAALDSGNAEQAFALCEPIAAGDPTGDAPRCAGLAAVQLGRGEEAVRYLRAYLAHHPSDEDVVLHLAREVGRTGDDAAARALLERYVERHPGHLRARVNLGVAYARLGDYARARSQWEAVLTQEPEHADARDLLSKLPPSRP